MVPGFSTKFVLSPPGSLATATGYGESTQRMGHLCTSRRWGVTFFTLGCAFNLSRDNSNTYLSFNIGFITIHYKRSETILGPYYTLMGVPVLCLWLCTSTLVSYTHLCAHDSTHYFREAVPFIEKRSPILDSLLDVVTSIHFTQCLMFLVSFCHSTRSRNR